MNFNQLKSWKVWVSFLISPMAVGFLITIITVWLTFDYYKLRGNQEHNQGIVSLVHTAHQKSFDYRLRSRGPRPVAKDLALLTVDERALDTIGRWPWSREVLAKAIDQAMENGVRVMAFDMVFPEPQQNPVQMVVDQVRADGKLSGALEETLMSYRQQLDADKALGRVYETHADRIVAGAFAALPSPSFAPQTEFCRDLIFKNTKEAKQWDKEEVLMSVNDPLQPYIPGGLIDFFNLALSENEKALRESAGPPKNRNEEVQLEAQILEALHGICDTALVDFREGLSEIWQAEIQGKENPKEFKFASYEEWLSDFQARSFPNAVISQEMWRLNTPEVAYATKHTAHFNTELDPDGTIRSKAMLVRTGNTYFPALSIKAYLVANNFNASPRLDFNPASGSKEVVEIEITNNETGETETRIPVDRQGKLLINYAGPDKMYPYFSFADLVTDSPEAEIEQREYDIKEQRWFQKKTKVKKAEFLKDKILIVGATAMGIYDLRVTPFQEIYPGAETHLNALDNIMNRNFFRLMPDEHLYMPLILAGIGLLLSIVLSFLGAIWGLALTAAALIGTWFFDQYYLFGSGIIVTIIWPLFLIVFLYVALTFYRYLTEERGKKELRQTFQKYVSPAIVEEILSDPKNIELGGKKVHLTVMFSDVRGFTTISEKLDPRALSDLLNAYLTPMTEIVFKNQGTLDKYMGDAIMSFFGAPIAYKDHAKYACRCALQSVQKLFELQKEFEKKGLPTIDLGIGLNTGDVSVGNMGSETVRSYTVMGDAVNLASRLEGINKQYGTRIILSEMTYNEVKDSFICREVDWVRVKGKVLPVKIYELIAEEKVPSAQTAEMLKWFNDGYNHYHAKAWKSGLECFSKALDLNPSDEVSKLYIERCQDYLTTPPEEGWDGVFVMKTK